MATGEIEIRGRQSFLTSLLVPRPLTRVFLFGLGLTMSALAWKFIDIKLLAYASGMAMPFCMMCATVVWGLRDKADDALNCEHLDAQAYKAACNAAAQVRQRSMRRAAWAAMCALVAGSPAIALQLTSGIWQWMVLLAGPAVGETIYAYLLANSWDEQLRAWRERQQVLLREREALHALMSRVESSATERQSMTGWTSDAGSLVPKSKPH